jgi:alpha(1,3/1,4) fucosyltransferase
MRIAITVNNIHSFFSAGSPQTALSLGETLRLKGHQVYFINTAASKENWWEDVKGVRGDWTVMHRDEMDAQPELVSGTDLLIEVGNNILSPAARRLFSSSVWLCRKPLIIQDIEGSLFPHEPANRDLSGVKEIWMIKEHATADDVQYAELLYRKPVRLIPLTWTPSAVESHRQEIKAPVWPQVKDMPDHVNRPWSIHICETHNSVASSCTIPLFIARETCLRGEVPLAAEVRIHNVDNIKEAEFFRKNVLEHAFSDVAGAIRPVFVGRNRTVDYVFDPMSIVIAHSRFVKVRFTLLDLLWLGIPLVHNSPVIRDLGLAGEAGYYRENEISQGQEAFTKAAAYAKKAGVDELIEMRKRIIEKFTPMSGSVQEEIGVAAEAAAAAAGAPAEPEVVAPIVSSKEDSKEASKESWPPLKVAFSDMWDGFNPEYNMFTLMLEASGVKRKVVSAPADHPDILIFGPFGNAWQTYSQSVPKIHYSGENSEPIQRADIKLNIGFKHLNFNDGRYLRLPLWMLEINWFRADPERIGNPKPVSIDACCLTGGQGGPTARPNFCAFVVTNPRQPMRNASFHWLNQYKPVDSAGRLFNNIGSQIFAGLGGGGGELAKVEFFRRYRFVLAYENDSSPGYCTEKLLHAKAAGAVPIYWGDPKVERDFDTSGFIDARGVTTAGELIRLVKEVEEDEALWKRKAAVPALDEVRRDMVRRTLSECARRIWAAAGVGEKELEGIPLLLGYDCDGTAPAAPAAPAASAASAAAEKAPKALPQDAILLTGCNAKFLPSLQMLLRSIIPHKLKATVYLMDDVTPEAAAGLNQDFPFAQTRRFPRDPPPPANFPDLWAPEHFAWKLWILKEAATDPAFAGKTLLYMDAGAVMVRWPANWVATVRLHGICNLADPREFNRYRCHEDFVKGMSMTEDELAANQIWAGAMCFVGGSQAATKLFTDAWALAQRRELIVGVKWTGQVVDGHYFGHRHDQSILSLLTKRQHIPVCDLDTVYCDVSMRHTYLTERSLYVHRGMYAAHKQVAHGIDEAWIINLDRRQDRLDRFKKNHPDLANHLMRLSAFEGTKLTLTPRIARLFAPHDFNWKKSVMGCALSHLALWMQLINEKPLINTYLVLEDDARLAPEWRTAWEKAVDDGHLPEDWDIVYLGGVLPPNREGFEAAAVEKLNASVARVKENRMFGQGVADRYFHFCAYSYVLTRRGAQKIVDFLRARGGYWTSADHMMCNIQKVLNIYFLHPLVAGCYQDDDPVYRASAFNDFSRKDQFDSDLWNNTERFEEGVVASAAAGAGTELDILGALEDARAAARAAKASEATPLTQTPPKIFPMVGKRRIVSIGFETDSSQWYEFGWWKTLFDGKVGMTVESIAEGADGPDDAPIVFLQRPHVEKARAELARWSTAGKKFYCLHLSDEYGSDPIDFYDLPGCLGVVRNYVRGDLPAKALVVPLGPHWAVPGGVPHTHTPRPPFRELTWSFIGTGWKGRKEKLAPLNGVTGDHRCVFMDDWNSPKMLGREETLAVLLNSWFVPCPGGQNAETFRVYEALEAGAVPVLVKEEGMEKYLEELGKMIPILVATDWNHAANLMHTLRAKPEVYEQYRDHILASWLAAKERVKGDIVRVFGL